MPSFYEPGRREELLDRFARLTPDRAAAWGRMDAPRMVRHLIESLRMANGELVPRPRPFPLQRLVRYLAIHVLPFPKGAPTAPELLARAPATWDVDLAHLRDLVARHPEPREGAPLPPHPAFGRMTKRDWGALLYKHLDHHLRQFGC